MPNRLIREDLLESEAVLSLPVEARWFFMGIMLSADDLGLFEATVFRLARRADVDRDDAPRLLQLLVDAGLIRLYEADGKRFGFIPKFRQRLQIKRLKHPAPPTSMVQDDQDALNKIKELGLIPTDGQPMPNGYPSVGQPSEPEPEPEVIHIPAATRPRRQRAADSTPTVPCPYERIVALFHTHLPTLPAVRLMPTARQKALRKVWGWILSSTKSDGTRRATTADQALEWFEGYFVRASENDFLMGRTTRSDMHANWRCDIDFLLTDRGMKHVIENTAEAAA